MFRVPTDPAAPSFDHTFKVGFFGWMGSSKAERTEWMRRRNLAAQAARQGQNARTQAYVDRKIEERRRP